MTPHPEIPLPVTPRPATPSHLPLLGVATIAAAAWMALAGGGLFAPHAHPAGIGGYAASVTFWFVMMVAMMLPALWPWLSLFGSMAPGAYPTKHPALVVAQFATGYFVVWMVYSAFAAALQGGLQQAALLRLDLRAGTIVGGVLLMVAGIFQFTPLKDACLAHCRSPLSFFLARWNGGPSGPFRMGARHGLFCVGCCWAMMALSFVLGIMNLLWMAVLTAMILAEQRAPKAWRLRQAFGMALVAWGALLLL